MRRFSQAKDTTVLCGGVSYGPMASPVDSFVALTTISLQVDAIQNITSRSATMYTSTLQLRRNCWRPDDY
jgi:hypothetical protein